MVIHVGKMSYGSKFNVALIEALSTREIRDDTSELRCIPMTKECYDKLVRKLFRDDKVDLSNTNFRIYTASAITEAKNLEIPDDIIDF